MEYAELRAAAAPFLRRFNPAESRDHDGKWTDGPGGAAAGAVDDLLDLAGKIKLGEGEHLQSSGRLHTNAGVDTDIMHAVIDTPGGREIRLGFIPIEDAGKWTAGNKGATANLSVRSAGHLRDDLIEGDATAKKAAKAADKAWQSGKPPDLKDSVASGKTASPWGDISWEIFLTDDEPTSWHTSLQITRGGTPVDAQADAATLTPGDLKKLTKLLDGMIGHNRSTYGQIAVCADPWIRERAQNVLSNGLPDLPASKGA